jgi:hypothetical protein
LILGIAGERTGSGAPTFYQCGSCAQVGPFMIRNGLRYAKPATFMRDYLAGIKTGPFKAPLPPRLSSRMSSDFAGLLESHR